MMQHLKKLKFQEQVIEEAKSAIKPYYESREISKTEYKDILKKAVNKVSLSNLWQFGEITEFTLRFIAIGVAAADADPPRDLSELSKNYYGIRLSFVSIIVLWCSAP